MCRKLFSRFHLNLERAKDECLSGCGKPFGLNSIARKSEAQAAGKQQNDRRVIKPKISTRVAKKSICKAKQQAKTQLRSRNQGKFVGDCETSAFLFSIERGRKNCDKGSPYQVETWYTAQNQRSGRTASKTSTWIAKDQCCKADR